MASESVLTVAELTVVHRLRRRSRTKGAPKPTVDRVSLTVPRGKIVALIGESGSGKTSTAMAIARLGPLTSGRIDLGGVGWSELRRSELRRHRPDMQMVFQDPYTSLNPRQRIRAGLNELRRLHPTRTAGVTDHELFARVGLAAELLDRFPGQLSGGQAQRVIIARALFLQPRVLLADEPTSALDVLAQARVLDILSSLATEQDIGILLVTHDLPVARKIADVTYIMRAGEIIEHGPTESVMVSPRHEYTKELIDAVPGREVTLSIAE